MSRTATLWPAGTSPDTVMSPSASGVPETSCRRAMTTSSSGCRRMIGEMSVAIVLTSDFPGQHTAHGQVVDEGPQAEAPGRRRLAVRDPVVQAAPAGASNRHHVAELMREA